MKVVHGIILMLNFHFHVLINFKMMLKHLILIVHWMFLHCFHLSLILVSLLIWIWNFEMMFRGKLIKLIMIILRLGLKIKGIVHDHNCVRMYSVPPIVYFEGFWLRLHKMLTLLHPSWFWLINLQIWLDCLWNLLLFLHLLEGIVHAHSNVDFCFWFFIHTLPAKTFRSLLHSFDLGMFIWLHLWGAEEPFSSFQPVTVLLHLKYWSGVSVTVFVLHHHWWSVFWHRSLFWIGDWISPNSGIFCSTF